MPYPLFAMTAEVLDTKRLGKQRLEAMQIYKIITGLSKSKAWRNHPSVKMWKGYESALACYYNCIRHEWIKRGFKNTMPELPVKWTADHCMEIPPWLGNERFHASHRSNLKRKAPSFYSKYNWTEPNDLPYYWPTKEGLM